MRNKKYTSEEEECIQNVFDSYMKKSIKRAVIYQISLQDIDKETYLITDVGTMSDVPSSIEVFDYYFIDISRYRVPIKDEKLYETLIQLNKEEMDIILLYYCEEIPLIKISKELNINYDTVKTKRKRGIEKLRRLLKEHGL